MNNLNFYCHKTNRLQFFVRVYCNRSQKTSHRIRNSSHATQLRLVSYFSFFRGCDVICDQLQYTQQNLIFLLNITFPYICVSLCLMSYITKSEVCIYKRFHIDKFWNLVHDISIVIKIRIRVSILMEVLPLGMNSISITVLTILMHLILHCLWHIDNCHCRFICTNCARITIYIYK